MTPNTLAVNLGERRIGIIHRLAGDRHLFAFEQDYVDDANRPTLSLTYRGQTGGLVTAVRAVSRRLPPFFSNLLPEGHLREYLANKAGVKPEREFFLLAALGKPRLEEDLLLYPVNTCQANMMMIAQLLRVLLYKKQLVCTPILCDQRGLQSF